MHEQTTIAWNLLHALWQKVPKLVYALQPVNHAKAEICDFFPFQNLSAT